MENKLFICEQLEQEIGGILKERLENYYADNGLESQTELNRQLEIIIKLADLLHKYLLIKIKFEESR